MAHGGEILVGPNPNPIFLDHKVTQSWGQKEPWTEIPGVKSEKSSREHHFTYSPLKVISNSYNFPTRPRLKIWKAKNSTFPLGL